MPAPAAVELAFVKPTVDATTATTPVSAATANIGDLVVVICTCGGFSATNVTDTKGNTYTRTVNFVTGGSVTTIIAWSILTVAVDTSTTWTVTVGGSDAVNVSVQKWPGMAASPLDGSNAAGATSTAINSANITTVGGDDLTIGVSGINNGALGAITPQVVSPVWGTFTTDHWFPTAVSSDRQFDAYYRNITGAGTYSYQATIASALWAAATIAFQVAATVGLPDLIMAPAHR